MPRYTNSPLTIAKITCNLLKHKTPYSHLQKLQMLTLLNPEISRNMAKKSHNTITPIFTSRTHNHTHPGFPLSHLSFPHHKSPLTYSFLMNSWPRIDILTPVHFHKYTNTSHIERGYYLLKPLPALFTYSLTSILSMMYKYKVMSLVILTGACVYYVYEYQREVVGGVVDGVGLRVRERMADVVVQVMKDDPRSTEIIHQHLDKKIIPLIAKNKETKHNPIIDSSATVVDMSEAWYNKTLLSIPAEYWPWILNLSSKIGLWYFGYINPSDFISLSPKALIPIIDLVKIYNSDNPALQIARNPEKIVKAVQNNWYHLGGVPEATVNLTVNATKATWKWVAGFF